MDAKSKNRKCPGGHVFWRTKKISCSSHLHVTPNNHVKFWVDRIINASSSPCRWILSPKTGSALAAIFFDGRKKSPVALIYMSPRTIMWSLVMIRWGMRPVARAEGNCWRTHGRTHALTHGRRTPTDGNSSAWLCQVELKRCITLPKMVWPSPYSKCICILLAESHIPNLVSIR